MQRVNRRLPRHGPTYGTAEATTAQGDHPAQPGRLSGPIWGLVPGGRGEVGRRRWSVVLK
jgi:hypothetical protein